MAALLMGNTDWSLSDGTIWKRCSYAGLPGGASRYDLRIEITTTRSHQTALLEPHVRLLLDPDPLPGIEDVRLQGQLVVPDTPYDPPPAPVTIDHAENTLMIAVASTQESENFVETISSGESLVFVLLKGTEHLLELPIPNNIGVLEVLRQALD